LANGCPDAPKREDGKDVLIEVTDRQAMAVLAALREVATAGGARELTSADQRALEAFKRFVLRRDRTLDLANLLRTSPPELARIVDDPDARTHVAQFLVVMALVDGVVDEAKIRVVIDYAAGLGVHEDGVRQLAELGRGNLAWVRADVQRQNLRSIAGHAIDVPIDEWIVPYREHPDTPLADRYRALGKLSVGTFGRAFFEFYRTNGFAFPGESQGINARFAAPHDSSHVLSGYDISPQGELLVSTFTAGMHPQEPMAGHILPVIISWHLGIELVHFAGSTTGQLDPTKFWVAWERGAEVTTDVFADGWDIFAVAAEPLEEIRAGYHVPPLDPAHAADGILPSWYRPAP
jgi:hypothetical protein